jgi:hypothetical protein
MHESVVFFLGKPEWMRSFGWQMSRYNDIKMDFKQFPCKYVDYNQMVQDVVQWSAVLNTIMHIRISYIRS